MSYGFQCLILIDLLVDQRIPSSRCHFQCFILLDSYPLVARQHLLEKSQPFHQSQQHCRARIQQIMVMKNMIRSVSPQTGRDELQVTHPQAQLHPFQRHFSLKISKCRACNRLKLKLQPSQRTVPTFTSKLHTFTLKFCCSVTQLKKQCYCCHIVSRRKGR